MPLCHHTSLPWLAQSVVLLGALAPLVRPQLFASAPMQCCGPVLSLYCLCRIQPRSACASQANEWCARDPHVRGLRCRCLLYQRCVQLGRPQTGRELADCALLECACLLQLGGALLPPIRRGEVWRGNRGHFKAASISAGLYGVAHRATWRGHRSDGWLRRVHAKRHLFRRDQADAASSASRASTNTGSIRCADPNADGDTD